MGMKAVEQAQAETEGKTEAVQERGHWGSKAEFLLAVAGNIVGLGNVWRFPYLCYKNGGGTFLIPYLVFTLTCGLPQFLLETSMGQYTQDGGITCWRRLCPLAQGIGFAGHVTLLYDAMSYIIILAWALLYLCFSFSTKLPWASCDNTWNTDACDDMQTRSKAYNWTALLNSTSAATEFWERRVLSVSGGVEEMGSVRWELLLCLIAVWVICYFCVWKGVKSAGKVVYFTATFPYVMLLVLLVRGLTLPGALQGVVYYLYPEPSRLLDPQVWKEAGTQIFFSYSLSGCTQTVLGSYNSYHNNCYRDCIWLAVLNSGTSFVAGFAVFSVLGFMAHELGAPIEKVAESGPGLAFIAYPQAVAMMPFPQLWAVCFFIMLLLLGLDTQFTNIEVVMTSVTDMFPAVLRRPGRREIFLLVYCLFCFCIGLVFITEGGMYVLLIFDYYACNGACQLFIAVSMSLTMAWVFGTERIYDIIEDMTGKRPSPMFWVCWRYLMPAVSLMTFISFLVRHKPLTFNRTYVYPGWVHVLGWIMSLSSILMIPIVALFYTVTGRGSLKQRWIQLCRPANDLPLTKKQRRQLQDMTSDGKLKSLVMENQKNPEEKYDL